MSKKINWPTGGRKIECCPLWNTEAVEYGSNKPDHLFIFSPRAGGWYNIKRSSHFALGGGGVSRHMGPDPEPSHSDKIVMMLSAYIWQQNHDHWKINKPIPRDEDMLVIDSKIEKDAESRSMPNLSRRIENFMLCLYDLTQRRLGNEVSYNALMVGQLQAASYCYDDNEFNFLLANSILGNPGYAYRTADDDIGLTPEGYKFVEELQSPSVASDQVFVAMWFDKKQMGKAREAIEKGIEDAGYKAVFIDNKQFNGGITDEIIAEIRRSRFVVADFTSRLRKAQNNSLYYEARGGVYYEAGFAHGLGREVIYICREDCMEKVHFDIRHINHIVWEKGEYKKLTDDLANRIGATIGDGPNKKRPD